MWICYKRCSSKNLITSMEEKYIYCILKIMLLEWSDHWWCRKWSSCSSFWITRKPLEASENDLCSYFFLWQSQKSWNRVMRKLMQFRYPKQLKTRLWSWHVVWKMYRKTNHWTFCHIIKNIQWMLFHVLLWDNKDQIYSITHSRRLFERYKKESLYLF